MLVMSAHNTTVRRDSNDQHAYTSFYLKWKVRKVSACLDWHFSGVGTVKMEKEKCGRGR